MTILLSNCIDFIRGKFDQLSYGSANRPYSGIASAFAEYCSAVEQRDQETWEELKHKLRHEVKGEEVKLLFEAIPSLRKIFGEDNDFVHHHNASSGKFIANRRHSCSACSNHHLHTIDEEEKLQHSLYVSSENRNHILNQLIKRVTSVMSSIGDPIVFLIDDIQVSVYMPD